MTTRQQIDRIKNTLNIAEDKELAALLGISPKVVGQWAIRKNISKEGWVLLKSIGIDKEVVLTEKQKTTTTHVDTTPQTNKNGVRFFAFETPEREIYIPLWNTPISHGMPNSILDDTVTYVNATKHYHADSFYVEAKGRSMEGAGIKEGMRLLIDKTIEHTNGRIVLACVDGEYTVKRLKTNGKVWLLHPDSDIGIPIIEVTKDVEIIGVVVRLELNL